MGTVLFFLLPLLFFTAEGLLQLGIGMPQDTQGFLVVGKKPAKQRNGNGHGDQLFR